MSETTIETPCPMCDGKGGGGDSFTYGFDGDAWDCGTCEGTGTVSTEIESEPEHSPTPWRVGKNGRRVWIDSAYTESSNAPDMVCTLPSWGPVTQDRDKKEVLINDNAERIVACANACDGVSSSDMSAGSVAALIAKYNDALAALYAAQEALNDDRYERGGTAHLLVQAAIKASGQEERLAAVVARTNAAHKDAFIEGVTQL